MRYFQNDELGNKVVDILKGYGYPYAKYTSFGENNDDLILGSSPNRYINLRFDKYRGFHMSTTGTWVEGEGMKQVEHEAKLVNEIFNKLKLVLNQEATIQDFLNT